VLLYNQLCTYYIVNSVENRVEFTLSVIEDYISNDITTLIDITNNTLAEISNEDNNDNEDYIAVKYSAKSWRAIILDKSVDRLVCS